MDEEMEPAVDTETKEEIEKLKDKVDELTTSEGEIEKVKKAVEKVEEGEIDDDELVPRIANELERIRMRKLSLEAKENQLKEELDLLINQKVKI